MEFNQIFTAPTIPNLKERIIQSSSVRRVARRSSSTPLLNRSRFLNPRFRRELTSPEDNSNKRGENLDLLKLKKETDIKISKLQEEFTFNNKLFLESLQEVNKSLSVIKEQLFADYSDRIKIESEKIKKSKIQKEKKKRVEKEQFVETLGKIGKKATNLVSFITNPVKGIFSKIAEFFTIILKGIVVNNVFNWLSKKENREKIKNVFNFLVDNWKLIAGIIVGGVALRALYKIIKLVSSIRRLLKFLRLLPKKMIPGTTSTRGGIFRTGQGFRRGIYTQPSSLRGSDRYYGAGRSGLLELNRKYSGTPIQQFSREKKPLAKALQGIDVGIRKVGSDVMKVIGMGPGAKGIFKFLRPLFKRIPFIGGLLDFALSLVMGESVGKSAAKAAGAMLGGALGSFPPLVPFGGPIWGAIVGDMIASSIYDSLMKGKNVEDLEKQEKVPKLALGGKIKGPSHSSGGVLLEAEGGEFIVRKQEVSKYEPILRDINENGGRLWTQFIEGVKKQKEINDIALDNSNKFEDILSKYKEIVEEEEERLKERKFFGMGVGGGTKIQHKINLNNSDNFTSDRMNRIEKTSNSMKFENNLINSMKKITSPEINQNIQQNSILPTVYMPMLMPIPLTGGRDLTPAKKEVTVINLPPEIINSGSDMSSIEIPTYRNIDKEYPTIPSFDASNEYLNRSIFEYDIEGIRFGG